MNVRITRKHDATRFLLGATVSICSFFGGVFVDGHAEAGHVQTPFIMHLSGEHDELLDNRPTQRKKELPAVASNM